MNVNKWKLAGAGAMCCALAAFGLFDAMDKAGWRKAQAEVLQVTVACAMKATEQKVGYKEVSEATIPCEAVELFKQMHADKSWSSTEHFDAQLEVEDANGAVTLAAMALDRVKGRAPEAGDNIVVLQDPADPAKVAKAGSAGTGLTMAALFGAIGGGILWLAFRKPGEAKAGSTGAGKKPKHRAPVIDEEAEARASAARADALIANVLANGGRVNPEPKTAREPAPQPRPMAAGGMVSGGRRQQPMVSGGRMPGTFGAPAAPVGFGKKR